MVKTVTLEEFKAEIRAQEAVLTREDIAFICPCCGTVQSAQDLIDAGAAADLEGAKQHLGISCIGRFTGALATRREPDGKPCDWTLHGFLQLHTLVIVTPDGEGHPHFELATLEQATAHLAKKREAAITDFLDELDERRKNSASGS